MSTGAECRFYEVEPGRWTYWLQDYPWGANTDGETYGPFPSYDDALQHLSDNHTNPGGHSRFPLKDGRHVHEWGTGIAWVQVGWTVEVRVESLGPDATPEQVIALVKSLDAGHGAWQVRPAMGGRDGIMTCASCGERKT